MPFVEGAYSIRPMSPSNLLPVSIAALGLCAQLSCAWAADATPAADAPSFQPCRLEHRTRLASFAAECTTLRVPEDRQTPQGRQLELRIARIPAISRRKAPDPLFLIAGGPGSGTADMYPEVAAAFARIGRDRDIVLVDQRGTGGSNALQCKPEDPDAVDVSTAASVAQAADCLAALRQRSDPAQYTSSLAVQDLDRVREALGYERINIYGVSYGSRVAQHYLRRFPQRVRSLILDGVVPPGLVLGPDIALDAEAALTRILGRCAADRACAASFGDPTELYRRLRARLEQGPVTVSLADPTTGQGRTMSFTKQHLGVVLRLQSYSSTTASLLPLALHEAIASDNFVPLAGLFRMTAANLGDTISAGMHNSVVCTEDAPGFENKAVDRAQLQRTYIGAEQIDALIAVCRSWPRGPLDADFHQPLRSNAPVLLLSGEDDPVTPPAGAEAAMRGLANARHLRLAAQGHGQIGVTCMDRVVADFIRDLAPRQLDARCLDAVKPAPFFTSLAGPAP